MATPIFLTGFEYGLGTLVNNGLGLCDTAVNITTSSSVKNSGSYSMRASSTTASAQYVVNFASASAYFVGRVYFRLAAWPSDNDWILKLNASTSYGPGLWVNYTTHKVAGAITGEVGTYHDTELSLDTWYRVDFKADMSGGTTTFDFQINGVAGPQFTKVQAADTMDYIRLGSSYNYTRDVYYDDVIYSQTPADYPIGAGVTIGIRPSSDGTHSAGTVIKDNSGNVLDGATYTGYDKIDEDPWTSGDSNYIQQTGTGDYYAEVQFSNPAISGTIFGVSGLMQMSCDDAAINDGCTYISFDDFSSSTTLFDGDMGLDGTTMAYKRKLITVPGGGWTAAYVNALKARMGYSTNATHPPRWNGLILEVAAAASGRTGTYRDTTMIGTW